MGVRRIASFVGVRRVASFVALAAVAAAALAASLGLAACGGPTTYRNDTYRFSLDVHPPLKEWKSASTAAGQGFEVAFVDPDGATSGDRHLDALTVTAVTSSRNPTIDDLPQLRADLGSLAGKMVASLGTDTQAGEASPANVGGLPGVVVAYATTIDGRRVVGWQYLLVANGYTYGLNAGAAGSDWNRLRPAFERTIESFSPF